MMNFNAAAREVCIVRTEQTNTPLQALTLFNNKLFVESARNLAERSISQGGDTTTERLQFAFQTVLTRLPTEQELEILQDSLEFFLTRYTEKTSEAASLIAVGESVANPEFDTTTLAAYTMVASTIFNLDEAIIKR